MGGCIFSEFNMDLSVLVRDWRFWLAVLILGGVMACSSIIIFGTAYQQIENYFLSPRISAATLDIHPAIAFGSVIIGAALFGAMGAIIAIPLAAAITAIVDTYGQRYELIPALREDTPEATKRRARKKAAEELSTTSYEGIESPK